MEAKLTFNWMAVAKIQLEIIDFQENVLLKQAFCDCTPKIFWASRVSNVNFPALVQLAVQILKMFGSTYCYEFAFSIMNFVENKFRISMTNDIHTIMRNSFLSVCFFIKRTPTGASALVRLTACSFGRLSRQKIH